MSDELMNINELRLSLANTSMPITNELSIILAVLLVPRWK